VTAWLMRPLDKLVDTLLAHSTDSNSSLPAVPERLPRELVPLVTAYQTVMGRVEAARKHEKDFAYGAAHQLRTPVAGLLAVLEQAVARERTAEDLSQRITKAVGITEGIRGTLDTLMRIARLKSFQTNAPFVRYDAVAIVRDALDQEVARAGQGHRIEWEVPETVWVNGDDELFRILISILVENAVRYSPPGSALVVRIANEGSQFVLQLQNEAQEDLGDDPERLFQPFQRGEHAGRWSGTLPGKRSRPGAGRHGGHRVLPARQRYQPGHAALATGCAVVQKPASGISPMVMEAKSDRINRIYKINGIPRVSSRIPASPFC